VCARGGGGLLRERMALVAALWGAGLAAELLPAAAPSATAQYEYARAAGIAWMVTLQAATLSSSDTVVVSGSEGHQRCTLIQRHGEQRPV
jgi:eukaryotic translation initiation factor 2-alpha kinase 4